MSEINICFKEKEKKMIIFMLVRRPARRLAPPRHPRPRRWPSALQPHVADHLQALCGHAAASSFPPLPPLLLQAPGRRPVY